MPMPSTILCRALLSLAAITASAAWAQAPSPYAGQQAQSIKALDPAQQGGLLAGQGMGFAEAAELNHYPGPAHVLELATELQLTPEQRTASQAMHARMLAQAKALGARLVEAEATLDRLFASGAASAEAVTTALRQIGSLQAELRGAHLLAHIEQRAVLSAQQVERYDQLRGYGAASAQRPAHQHGHGHGRGSAHGH
jgi:hypothetical protein